MVGVSKFIETYWQLRTQQEQGISLGVDDLHFMNWVEKKCGGAPAKIKVADDVISDKNEQWEKENEQLIHELNRFFS